MYNNDIYLQIKTSAENSDFDSIKCLFDNKCDIRIDKYFEIAFEELYYYNYDSSYLMQKIIEYSEKYNYKINIHNHYNMDTRCKDDWIDWSLHGNRKVLIYFIYLMKHNYGFLFFMDKHLINYQITELVIKKHTNSKKTDFIFNNHKYNFRVQLSVNLYNICYMIVIKNSNEDYLF